MSCPSAPRLRGRGPQWRWRLITEVHENPSNKPSPSGGRVRLKPPMHGMHRRFHAWAACRVRRARVRRTPFVAVRQGGCLRGCDTFAITSSRLKEAGFWRGGEPDHQSAAPPRPPKQLGHVIDHPVPGVRVVVGALERIAGLNGAAPAPTRGQPTFIWTLSAWNTSFQSPGLPP